MSKGTSESPSLFTVYPAIDILNKQCVRLVQGDYAQDTVYNNDPVFIARKWASMGAKFLHVVDLDGAKDGEPVNLDVVKHMVFKVQVPIQLGGGIRNFETAKRILEAGVQRIILGSAIVKDREFVNKALNEFGDRVVISMDCRNGKLAFDGWTTDSDLNAIDVAKELIPMGLKIVNYTDIGRDGTLEGPNVEAIEEFANSTKVHTIASGGVSNINDVIQLKDLRNKGLPVGGVIIGRALYTGDIDLKKLFNEIQ